MGADLFAEWRAPRFGRGNPEPMNNPVWEWLIQTRLSAYGAKCQFGITLDGKEPGWCFDRLGQTSTTLSDGRVVLIGGEHEDFYDPDFNIYNDVVVQHAEGPCAILGYPPEIFPPTDFHTATLAGDQIIIIGGLGYPERRQPGTTQVRILNIADFAISTPATSGSSPGWIHSHEAIREESGNSILVRGGQVDPGGPSASLVENINEWRLHLADWRWERITDLRWQRWQVARKDGRPNHLLEFQLAIWSRQSGFEGKWEPQIANVSKRLGKHPDLKLLSQLYCPPIPHNSVPGTAGEPGLVRIEVEGVVVRYVPGFRTIQIIVEGTLPTGCTHVLISDLCAKLEALENAPCEVRAL